MILRVLDGDGLTTDSGTQGRRGYSGDYLFAWLGGTTPFDAKVYELMAQLGSRLLFMIVDDGLAVSVSDLMNSADQSPSYRTRVEACQIAVDAFLTDLRAYAGRARGHAWHPEADPGIIKKWIARSAMLLAAMRSEPVREGNLARGQLYTAAKPEQPYRAHSILVALARGHALVHGRTMLDVDDVAPVVRVAVDSMPDQRRRVFKALVSSQNGQLTVAEVQKALNVKHHETAGHVVDELDRLGVMEFDAGASPRVIRFQSDWVWCGDGTVAALLGI